MPIRLEVAEVVGAGRVEEVAEGVSVGISDSDVLAGCVSSADDDPLLMDVIVARPEEAEVRKDVC